MAVLAASCQSSVPKPEIKVNENYKFEISKCEYKYYGKIFCLGGDIQELVDVFGPYNRYIPRADAYVWDSMGIGVLCHHITEKTSEMTICFDCCEWIEPDDKESALPFNCFQGSILLEGIPFGNGITVDQLNNSLKAKGSELKFSYWPIMKDYNYEYDCEYDEVKSELISDQNHAFIIRPNSPKTYAFFTISDSREHKRLESEVKVKSDR
ncbi:MAG: hypothetical protein JXB34_09105 [Bacteroidales bacterium]|nr:hypothetical protein [Bacteroidales bacterium]